MLPDSRKSRRVSGRRNFAAAAFGVGFFTIATGAFGADPWTGHSTAIAAVSQPGAEGWGQPDVLASAAAPAADISQSQPIQAGDARVWFLREFDPALSLDTATIYANGVAIGQSRPGAAFSVDLAPGTYTFTVPNDVADGNQAPAVQLAAGARVYFNVDAEDWVDAGEGEQDHGRYNLDVRQISAPLAEKFLPALTEPPHS
jgi:hypothetical protein